MIITAAKGSEMYLGNKSVALAHCAIFHGDPIELFLVPASAPRLV